MNGLIIAPKSKEEYELIKNVLKKMNINSKPLSEEEMEDLGMVWMMRDADKTRKVSKETIMKTLKS